MAYLFVWDLWELDFIQISIFSIISFVISTFISDKFKFSSNKLIKLLQKLVFFIFMLALGGLIGYLLGYVPTIFDIEIIFCDGVDVVDDKVEVGDEVVSEGCGDTQTQIQTQTKTQTQSPTYEVSNSSSA
jgi:hypothetical protein